MTEKLLDIIQKIIQKIALTIAGNKKTNLQVHYIWIIIELFKGFDCNSQVHSVDKQIEDEHNHSNKKSLFSYKKGQLIGKGSFGEVYECLNLNTGELLAVKTVKVIIFTKLYSELNIQIGTWK